jgi:hypothetical protein
MPFPSSKLTKNSYHRVPKELISRFVKLCPTCQVRRGTARGSLLDTEKDSPPDYNDVLTSPNLLSPPDSRSSSVASRQSRGNSFAPSQTGNFAPSLYQAQNRWMSSAPQLQSSLSLQPITENTMASGTPGPMSGDPSLPATFPQNGLPTNSVHFVPMSASSYISGSGSMRHQPY